MIVHHRPVATILVAAVFVFGCAALVHPFSFEPITQDYSTTGPGASHVFRVANTTDSRIAVRVSVRPRRIEPDGTEVQGKDSEEFIVFPRQMLLEPGDRRSIRVRWSGPESIDAELAYRIVAEQMPVDMGTDEPTQGGGIRLTYRYEGSLYVVPAGAEPNLRVVSVQRSGDGETLRVEIINEGSLHTLLSGARLLLSREQGAEPDVELGPEELPGLAGENMLAGANRFFAIPIPDDLWDGPIYAEIECDEE